MFSMEHRENSTVIAKERNAVSLTTAFHDLLCIKTVNRLYGQRHCNHNIENEQKERIRKSRRVTKNEPESKAQRYTIQKDGYTEEQ